MRVGTVRVCSSTNRRSYQNDDREQALMRNLALFPLEIPFANADFVRREVELTTVVNDCPPARAQLVWKQP